MKHGSCPLCQEEGGTLLWRNDSLRVVHVGDANYPGYTRIIWNQHIAEMTELDPDQRKLCMDAVWQVEFSLRRALAPDKINLAQFGNMVPHLHWHIIPRWRHDPRFPEAIWASAPPRTSASDSRWLAQRDLLLEKLPRYHADLVASLNQAHSAH